MTARYAIYFAPPIGSAWWHFGADWLGRDDRDSGYGPARRRQLAAPAIDPGVLRQVTSAPRRYGFHMTLRAPFRLREGANVDALRQRMHQLGAQLSPIALGDLVPVAIGLFVALSPDHVDARLSELAAACVLQFDDLRAPPDAEELARRSTAALDARERELLQAYGYPYVLERFRPHFTLSGPTDPATRERLMQVAAAPVARLNTEHPLWLDRLCLFVEKGAGEVLLRVEDMELSR
jgi:hypothetical protein